MRVYETSGFVSICIWVGESRGSSQVSRRKHDVYRRAISEALRNAGFSDLPPIDNPHRPVVLIDCALCVSPSCKPIFIDYHP